ncbi:unnamed protein product [Aspergillus oryzae]|uniref:Unnamed protein product n=2 Tax=Aspergillus oryzae TaxID=5062 RepID=A0AAN4YVR2_ASPOZ|nr:unnamed protein product [Aspergillus oryzae]GMF95244.1 unnamed protein product [Aspergillus oryzae]GMG13013.1 unnamed protein product [Aspergillus oryzae]GMG36302.1 unnamed protein product [Aspergillus oryzae]GMG54526.1 unnamed protein product [Aspergillus oryzae var. brunneus]
MVLRSYDSKCGQHRRSTGTGRTNSSQPYSSSSSYNNEDSEKRDDPIPDDDTPDAACRAGEQTSQSKDPLSRPKSGA